MLEDYFYLSEYSLDFALDAISRMSCITLSSQILNDDAIYKLLLFTDLPYLKSLRIECGANLTNASRLKNFIIHFGGQIESFHWDFCELEVDVNDVNEMLLAMVNVKEISIYDMKLTSNDNVTILNLPNLLSLTCYCSDLNVHKLILRIASVKLRRFTIFSKHCESPLNINRFFRRNRNLMKISLYGRFTNLIALRHMTQLRNLYIENCLDARQTLCVISRLWNISFLDVNVTNVSSCAISSLNQLSALKSLVLRGLEADCQHFEELSKITIPNLLSMKLDLGDVSSSEEVLARIGLNYPQLESFEMSFTENRNVYDFIANLKQVESLTMNFELNEHLFENFSTYLAGMQQEVDETNLKQLNLNFINFKPLTIKDNNNTLLRIVNFLPRLETLNIHGIKFSFDEVYLKNLLNVWHRIEELDVDFTSGECKNFERELICIMRLLELIEEFSINLDISIQCLTHMEMIKTDLCSLGAEANAAIQISCDTHCFKVEIENA